MSETEPGGSGAGSTVKRVYRSRTKDELKAALQLFIDRKATLHVPVDEEHDADCILADGIYELEQLRGDLESARESNVILDTALQHCCEANQDFERRLEQSRATEAELRAKLWRLQKAGRNVTELFYEGIDVAAAVAQLQGALDANNDTVAALSAAEPPARAEAELEQIIGPGYELMHTQRIGWMLRRYETNRARVGLAEVDSAPDGSLGALLVRHQRRVRGELQQGENANGA
jgi:hypothetical protein